MTGAAHSDLVLVDRLFWAISGFLCVAVFILALWNKRFKTFPLFFSLVGCYPIEFVIFFTIQSVVRSYTVWSWSMSFLLVSVFFLELTVLYQLANIIIFSHASVARHLKSVLRWTLALFVLCVTILAALGGNVSKDVGVSAFAGLSLAQDILETGLLVALVVLTRILAISWKSLPAGVALGWGISSSFNLVTDAIIRATNASSILREDAVRAAGFNACVLIWLWYTLRRPAPASTIARNLPVADSHLEAIEDMERLLQR